MIIMIYTIAERKHSAFSARGKYIHSQFKYKNTCLDHMTRLQSILIHVALMNSIQQYVSSSIENYNQRNFKAKPKTSHSIVSFWMAPLQYFEAEDQR